MCWRAFPAGAAACGGTWPAKVANVGDEAVLQRILTMRSAMAVATAAPRQRDARV